MSKFEWNLLSLIEIIFGSPDLQSVMLNIL